MRGVSVSMLLGLLLTLAQASGAGSALPATCTTNDRFLVNGAAPYVCASTNVWQSSAVGFFSIVGPTTPTKIFTFPDANATILTSNAAVTVAQGGNGAAPAGDDQVLVSSSVSAAAWKTINDCQGAGKALTYTQSTNAFGCNTISGAGPTYVVLSGDITNATTSYADITGLVIPVAANTRYDIFCMFVYSANATTTGIGIGWVGPAAPTLTGGQMVTGITTATPGYTVSVGNDTGAVTTASVATTGNFATFEGLWSNGANAGSIQMRIKAEVAVASAITIKAGSWCKVASY